MAVPVIMPRQGQTVESCVITKWEKHVGDTVNEGDLLFTYETDKATFDAVAPVSGTLLATFFKEDEDVACLLNVAVIGKPGEDVSQFDPNCGSSAPAVAPEAAAEAETTPVTFASTGTADIGKISPRARMAAERLCVDAAQAVPSGPNGRIIERDIMALAASGKRATPAGLANLKAGAADGSGLGGRVTSADSIAAAGAAPVTAAAAVLPADVRAYEEVKVPNIRKAIARSMHASLSELAQLTISSSFDAAAIMAYRKQLAKAEELGLPKISLNDIVLYAVSRVLKNYKDLNAHFTGETMRYFSSVNLGMAVDTPRGLIVPTLFGADALSLSQISEQAKTVAKAAQEGSINPDLLSGATFTITNLGSFGVEHFTPIINPPQTGILGVNCITQRVKDVNGEMKMYPAMGLSITIDHRAVDGAPAARFLKELGYALENFPALLAR